MLLWRHFVDSRDACRSIHKIMMGSEGELENELKMRKILYKTNEMVCKDSNSYIQVIWELISNFKSHSWV